MTSTIIKKICSPPLHQSGSSRSSNILLVSFSFPNSLVLFASDGLPSCARRVSGPSGLRSARRPAAREGGLDPEVLRSRDLQGALEEPLRGAERRPPLHLGQGGENESPNAGSRFLGVFFILFFLMCWNLERFTASAAAWCQRHHRGLALAGDIRPRAAEETNSSIQDLWSKSAQAFAAHFCWSDESNTPGFPAARSQRQNRGASAQSKEIVWICCEPHGTRGDGGHLYLYVFKDLLAWKLKQRDANNHRKAKKKTQNEPHSGSKHPQIDSKWSQKGLK